MQRKTQQPWVCVCELVYKYFKVWKGLDSNYDCLMLKGNLRSWLLDGDCNDQYSVIHAGGDKVDIFVNTSTEPILVKGRPVRESLFCFAGLLLGQNNDLFTCNFSCCLVVLISDLFFFPMTLWFSNKLSCVFFWKQQKGHCVYSGSLQEPSSGTTT